MQYATKVTYWIIKWAIRPLGVTTDWNSVSLRFTWTYEGISVRRGWKFFVFCFMHECRDTKASTEEGWGSFITTSDGWMKMPFVQCKLNSLRLSGLMSLLSQTKVTNWDDWISAGEKDLWTWSFESSIAREVSRITTSSEDMAKRLCIVDIYFGVSLSFDAEKKGCMLWRFFPTIIGVVDQILSN